MLRKFAIVLVACGLVAIGWVAGRAQVPGPDFTLIVDAPEGSTNIECVEGCRLAWVERGVNPNAAPQTTFTYRCNGVARCSSGRVGGWTNH
jgi:hypothetical protein